MAQLEPYQYVYLGSESSKYFYENDPVHYNIGCLSCHGGQPKVISESTLKEDRQKAMENAHEGMVVDPSENPLQTCGACHEEITEHNENSMHTQLWGEQYKIAQRVNGSESIEDCPADAQEKFGSECMSCHTTCGQCHISRPNTVHAGLLDKHVFQKTPDMANNCTACHGSRIGKDFYGELHGNLPDVHFTSKSNNDCLVCHQEDLHGDGTEAENPPRSRYEVNGLPTCEECHTSDADDNLYHQTHWSNDNPEDGADLSCFVCHSQPYVSCDGCHTQGQWKDGYTEIEEDIHVGDNGYYREYPDFKIGVNPSYQNENSEFSPALQTHYVDKWVLLRHIPVSEETYDNWGVEQENFDSHETWEYTSPHNIQRWTAQTMSDSVNYESYTEETCGAQCHFHGVGFTSDGSTDLTNFNINKNLENYLISDNVITNDSLANTNVIVRKEDANNCGTCH